MSTALQTQKRPDRRRPGKYRVGDRVTHAIHGLGKIVAEWGGWFFCYHCLDEVPPKSKRCTHPECRKELGTPSYASGTGTYDILFQGERTPRYIHESRLEPFEPELAVLAPKAEPVPTEQLAVN